MQTPLPAGVGAFVRVVLNAPAWLQITVIAVGVLVALAVVAWLWVRRAVIVAWFRTRSRGYKIALAAIALAAVTGAATFGTVTWNYTQHNNDFCIGCHVMGNAWGRFQHSEHRKLKCHDCHQQSIFASMRQLYLWVTERPNSIPPHAKVPTTICKNCHDQSRPDSAWKHVLATAGHSVHLRNDKPALRNVQCVTCHGAEVHHFVPIDKTCGQAGCHERLQIKLGKMAGQTSMHCTGCHNFTREIAANVSPDSALVSLTPTGDKCLGCHEMKQRLGTELAQMDSTRDPHQAVCGSCHNPHKQSLTSQAFTTCATAQCHARPDTLSPFHRGLPAAALASCGNCHKAHVWKVPSTACKSCHRDLDHPLKGAGVHPPLPQTKAASAAPGVTAPVTTPSVAPRHGGPSVEADEAPENGPSFEAALQFPAPPVTQAVSPAATPASDTTKFAHARHKSVECTACHSSETSHGALTIRQPAGCLECHHAPRQKAACVACHTTPGDRIPAVALAMTVWNAPRTRTMPFAHDRHKKIECRSCHTTPTTLAPATTCASCHADHHTQSATCASCHPAVPVAAQRQHPRVASHTGCAGAGCHSDAAVLGLAPTRNVCIACHRDKTDHKPGGDCASCHLVGWNPTAPGARR